MPGLEQQMVEPLFAMLGRLKRDGTVKSDLHLARLKKSCKACTSNRFPRWLRATCLTCGCHAHADEEEEEEEEEEEVEEGEEDEGDEGEEEEGSQAGQESQPLDAELGESFFCKKMFVSGLRSAPGVPTEVTALTG